jgi:hypothetical protein
METSERVRRDREARFSEGVSAFIRRDFEAIGKTMRPDVVMRIPGWSWLAGSYRGPEEVGRCILSLRQVLDSSEDRISFLHDEDQVIVTHEIKLHGALHHIDMTFTIRVSYDTDERVKSISVEPADLGLFDHVLKSFLVASDSSRPA